VGAMEWFPSESEAIAMVVSCYFGGENFYFAPQFLKIHLGPGWKIPVKLS
jgi:hypothetical protein